MTRLPLTRLVKLASRQLRRELRAGELRVLFFALLIAVASSCAIGYFTARLNEAMTVRATEFLGGDLALRGTSPAHQTQIDTGLAIGLKHARTIEFSSVIAGEQAIQLSSIKAVDGAYPLRGQLKSATEPQGIETVGGLPAPGEAWVEARLLPALDLKVGDRIEVGRKTLQITRILTYEPDRAGDFYSLTPRILMNLTDLAATDVIQPGSRVRYRDLWSGEPESIARYRTRLLSTLDPSQRIEDAHSGNRQLGSALDRARRYLGLASLAAVLLAGVAVAMSANRFAVRRFDASALLRCLGLSRREALLLYTMQLAMLGLAASLLGAFLGWLAQFLLFYLMADLLPAVLPSGGIFPALAGMGTGLIALAGFALPPLAALGRVPPLRVLRSDLLPVPPRSWIVYGMALLALGLIMWRLSLDLKLTLALLGGGLVATLLLGTLLLLGLNGLRRLLASAPLAWRLGLGQLLRHPLAAAGQALAFGLILFAMALIVLLRSELLDRWQDQLPPDSPNYFALNILPAERDTFTARVAALSPNAKPLYPIVQGRLVTINGEPARDVVERESRGDRATRRDLSLTWTDTLPTGNVITAGTWWSTKTPDDLPGVSVEAQLAESLKVGVGDHLSFNIAGRILETRVTSLRTVDWNTFQPNFFMIFEPGSFTHVPVTYLTSFYIPPGNDRAMVALARSFPATTLLPIDSILGQLRSILDQVTIAVEFVLLFVLAAGLTVLFAGLQSTLDERVRQGALLRALGSERLLLIRTRRVEFALLGATSGVLAALGCELVTALLYRLVFDLSWQPHLGLLVLPLAGALLVTGAGLLGTRRALTVSPLRILREG
ncbi:putative ABC transport system permease protein [Pseudomonas duriflava]|uniref:Putative ABC transport system permease protein n=1 Tax=Pseudomonas duriflava TaxID=459528 RepID=A0A562Q9L0_9PSED|nr:ABC transporter permease [Pseudomonas duriflava]TWI53455.1 putative ABC transport system permease protein [Pseudomonas duriflava]